MKFFLTDLWSDLREKRLWPVAVALVAGLVAVPVVLKKPSEAPPEPAPAASEARTPPEPKDLKGLARVTLAPGGASGSRLDTFDPSDPFQPPSKVLNASQEGSQVGASQSGPDPDSGSVGPTVSSGAGGAGGDTGSTVTTGPDTGGDTGTGGGDGGSDNPTPQISYVVDVTFTANGRKRRIRSLERLDMLPSRSSPLLLFRGVSSKGGNAVFLVDSTLQTAGEGKCRPTAAECAMLHIGAGSKHEFTSGAGGSYTLRIHEIRKVKPGSSGAAAAPASKPEAGASAPAITRVAPMRIGPGDMLTIEGRGFARKRVGNTIIFHRPNGRIAFAKPHRASPTELVVAVPAGVGPLLEVDASGPIPTRLELSVLAGRFSKFTSRRLSPVVTGA